MIKIWEVKATVNGITPVCHQISTDRGPFAAVETAMYMIHDQGYMIGDVTELRVDCIGAPGNRG